MNTKYGSYWLQWNWLGLGVAVVTLCTKLAHSKHYAHNLAHGNNKFGLSFITLMQYRRGTFRNTALLLFFSLIFSLSLAHFLSLSVCLSVCLFVCQSDSLSFSHIFLSHALSHFFTLSLFLYLARSIYLSHSYLFLYFFPSLFIFLSLYISLSPFLSLSLLYFSLRLSLLIAYALRRYTELTYWTTSNREHLQMDGGKCQSDACDACWIYSYMVCHVLLLALCHVIFLHSRPMEFLPIYWVTHTA